MEKNCFAYSETHRTPTCRILTEMVCIEGECGFHKTTEKHLTDLKKYDGISKAFCLSNGITRKPLSLQDDARLRTLQARTKLEDVRKCPVDSTRGYCRLHGHGFMCLFSDGTCIKQY